jgi:hypothetical protein
MKEIKGAFAAQTYSSVPSLFPVVGASPELRRRPRCPWVDVERGGCECGRPRRVAAHLLLAGLSSGDSSEENDGTSRGCSSARSRRSIAGILERGGTRRCRPRLGPGHALLEGTR